MKDVLTDPLILSISYQVHFGVLFQFYFALFLKTQTLCYSCVTVC